MRAKRMSRISAVVVAVVAVVFGGSAAYAVNNSTLTQLINPGVLSTDIVDAGGTTVAAPTVPMNAQNFSFACQTSTSVNPFGTATEQIYVANGDAADSGWTLTVAATGTPTALWQNTGNTQNYDFNDPSGSGCTDGGDADTRGGQLTLNPSVGTITPESGYSNTGITVGSSAAFSQGVTDSITLINAASGSEDIWRGYLTGVGVSQQIPAEQPADTYNLNLTLTATAL